jgi:CDP-diacylglycerol--glycerol-3-phosphate 3-phosphatidyltransferase
MITLTSAFMHIGIAWLVAMEKNLWAALFLLIFGLFDALDGSLARLQGSESRFGMLLDSMTDRIKEFLLYAGAAYAMVASGHEYWTVWAVLAVGGAFLVSYSNAWGEAMIAGRGKAAHTFNRTFRSGVMTFDVRLFIFWVGLLTNLVIPAVVIIAVGSLFTAWQRLNSINKALEDAEG